MKTVELFAGTKSFSNIMKKYGHTIYTVDNDIKFNCNETIDLLYPTDSLWEKIKECDVVWMSPPCTTFSLASGGTHWNKEREPRTKQAIIGYKLLKKCEEIAQYCINNNKIFFIENPNGRAVWFLPDKRLKKCWYCQYGDTRAKPTNIWTNLDIEFKTCHNYRKGKPKHCHHESAPRGSKTGTQGIKHTEDRSRIPGELFEYILTKMSCKPIRNVI